MFNIMPQNKDAKKLHLRMTSNPSKGARYCYSDITRYSSMANFLSNL